MTRIILSHLRTELCRFHRKICFSLSGWRASKNPVGRCRAVKPAFFYLHQKEAKVRQIIRQYIRILLIFTLQFAAVPMNVSHNLWNAPSVFKSRNLMEISQRFLQRFQRFATQHIHIIRLYTAARACTGPALLSFRSLKHIYSKAFLFPSYWKTVDAANFISFTRRYLSTPKTVAQNSGCSAVLSPEQMLLSFIHLSFYKYFL